MKSGLHLLFSRIYIACKAPSGDMNKFFKHENHYWPLSLAENNLLVMRFGDKSDLLKCLETLAPRPEATPTLEVKIYDWLLLSMSKIQRMRQQISKHIQRL